MVEWLERWARNQHDLGSKPTRAILLCPWERHFTEHSPAWWSWQAVLNYIHISIKFCGLHKSQSFFRSYGSVLPTSLVCIVRYRSEASRLGDLMRLIGTHSMHSDCQRPARIFKGRPDARRTRPEQVALFGRPANCFSEQLASAVGFFFDHTKKRELFQGPGSSSPNSATRRRFDPDHETRGPISRVEARKSVLDSLSGRRLSKQRVLRLSPVALRRGSVVEWLKHWTDDQHGLGSKPTCAILLCPWKRHFTAFSSA